MRADYPEIFRDPAVVDRYEHLVYAPESYASAVDRRQRRYLRALVARTFPGRRPVHHDFACGTGRAIRLLQGLVRAAHGYDASDAMLRRARERGVPASLHRIPATGPLPEPVPSTGPVLVTAFRTLLNADPATRDRVVAFAAALLPAWQSGLLVVENHGNRRSLRHLRHRRRRAEPWFDELSHAQVAELLARYGFQVVERRGCALLPRGCYRWPGLRWLARRIDDLAAGTGILSGWSVVVLYVARRAG
jgi:predicted TPR repeat methyltransferase